jgi:hypothetical protein
VGNISPGALPGGQQGTQSINGVTIRVDRWAATLVNPADAPLTAADAGLGLAPVNSSDVTNSSVPPSINPPAEHYEQPSTAAPVANPAVTISGAAPPNQIEATEENYQQPNTAAPAANAEIGVPTFRGNPMGL